MFFGIIIITLVGITALSALSDVFSKRSEGNRE